eukprot:GHVT01080406.1.p2 GENE.GHVT01080406.1~~GHVT01080406.1.p2  ORF type:complete len:128 (+),score=21.68 GHVT01080406.1:1022-1405(+)
MYKTSSNIYYLSSTSHARTNLPTTTPPSSLCLLPPSPFHSSFSLRVLFRCFSASKPASQRSPALTSGPFKPPLAIALPSLVASFIPHSILTSIPAPHLKWLLDTTTTTTHNYCDLLLLPTTTCHYYY